MDFSYADIAKMIDHSLLRPSLTAADLEAGCRLARQYDVAIVCVMPFFTGRAAELLAGSDVKAGATVGFPHGGHATAVKAAEARQAVADGARELDMVVNVSQALSGRWDYVRDDIAAVLAAARDGDAKLKVIFENCYLGDEHKIRLCQICGGLGVDWVKTSTGFAAGGATLDDVKLMRDHSPPAVQIKAAGGIRDLDTLLAYRALGCTRIGASRTADILDELKRQLS
ncbi:MAG TPA: deoxyribose-phosphate aldolase [Phycisphaerae bacterium]|nr:deoxyribose-phosphate aldolase [Phycisphaerae bacterium]